jgi:hypothetical protein
LILGARRGGGKGESSGEGDREQANRYHFNLQDKAKCCRAFLRTSRDRPAQARDHPALQSVQSLR